MPALHIDIEARFAKFQDALTAIERNTQKSANNMTRAFGGLKSTLAGLGVGLSVAGIAAIVKTSIEAADHLNDLSQKTGIAVSTLGGLGFAAGKAGGDLESVAEAAGKLNKAIAGAAGGNKQFAEAFDAMGISISDAGGNLKKADEVMAEIATRFAGFEDGPQKAAIALRLFGKSGADIIPLLNEGGESLRKNIDYYRQFGGVTDEVAQRADKFNDTMADIGIITGSFGRTLAAELLPTMQNLADYMLDAKNEGEGFKTMAEGLATVLKGLLGAGASVAYVFKGIGTNIGGTLAMLDRIAVRDFKGAKTIRDSMLKDQEDSRGDFERFMTNLQNGTAPALPEAAGGKGGKPAAPVLRTGGGAGSGDDPARRILEGQLKALERQSDEERTLLSTRQDFLQTYYQQDLVSITDYYDARRAAADEALRAQTANIEKEIALLQGFKPKDARAAADRDNKVAELQDKKSALEKAAGLEGQRLFIEQTKAASEYESALNDINSALLEQQGRLADLAAQNFDRSFGRTRQKVEVERQSALDRGDTAKVEESDAVLAKLDRMRELAVAQGGLNELSLRGARIQDDLAIATERAMLAAETGAVTELESLRMVSDARAQSAADLQKVADAFEQVALAANDPTMIQQAQAMQVEVAKLAESADLVREKFEDIFSGSFESALEKLMSGTASLKDAAKGFLNDIAGELNRMVSRNIAEQLFSKEGAFGGVADFFSGVFGGKPKAPDSSGGSPQDVALSLQAQSFDANRLAMDGLTQSALNAAGALANIPGTVSGATPFAANDGATGEFVNVQADASDTVDDFGKTAISAASDISQLAAAAGAGGDALARMPAIISLIQSIAAASSASGGGSGGGIIGSLINLFAASSTGAASGPAVINHLFADGAAFDTGNVIPFAKGGIPSSIVDTPTLFPMSGGRTGLMGEAGPEGIMPLKRDERGRLSVTVVGDDGKVSLMPLTRDPAGRLAVKAQQAFARGAAFSGGSLVSVGARAEAVVPSVRTEPARPDDGGMTVHNHFHNDGPVDRRTQQQLASAMYSGTRRAYGRNG